MNNLKTLRSNLSHILLADSLLSILIFFIAFSCSLLVADGRYQLNPHGILEINTAMNFVEGKGFYVSRATEDGLPEFRLDITKPPLYQFLIACLIKAGISGKSAAWMISQGSFVLSAVMLFILARLCMPKVPSLIVGCLFSVLISTQMYGISAKEDALYMAFTFASLLWVTKLRLAKQTNLAAWLILGLLTAAAILTRYIGISLVAAIFLVLTFDSIFKKSPTKCLYFFCIGIALTGLLPFINFVSSWSKGIRPAFYEPPGTSWYATISGIISSFQRDFAGTLVVWLYDLSIIHLFIVFGFVGILTGILYWFIRLCPKLSAVGIYVFLYLVILTFQLALNGFYPYEHRLSFPIEGLLILIITFLVWSIYKPNMSQTYRIAASFFAISLVGIYLNGQWLRFKEYDSFSGTASSREYCPSPKAIAWIQSHIPSGEAIFGNQCSYQLLAETNDYFWLTIPPTDEYSSSPRYNVKWKEEDFIRIKQKTGAQWIALLLGQNGDPLIKTPGYGDFVNKLYKGQESSSIKLQAIFSDGLIFKIQ